MDLTNIEMTEADKAALQPVVNRLGALVAVTTTRLVHDAIDKPVPDSLVGKAKKADLSDAYDQARQRLSSAEDHFRTVLTVLTRSDTLPNFSLFTLVRGAAIPTVHARYLLERAIDETARMGRGLSARLQNQEQQRKVHADADVSVDDESADDSVPAGEDVPADKRISADEFFRRRVDHLRERAEANGIDVVRDRNDSIIGFGERWPVDTDLFEVLMPGIGKTYFQYLSGYAHSLPWAQLPIHRAEPSDEPGIKLVPTDLNVRVFAAVLYGALSLYDETIGLVLAHAGYPPLVWAEAKKS